MILVNQKYLQMNYQRKIKVFTIFNKINLAVSKKITYLCKRNQISSGFRLTSNNKEWVFKKIDNSLNVFL